VSSAVIRAQALESSTFSRPQWWRGRWTEPQHPDQRISDTHEFRLEAENLDLRRLLAQAGIDAAEQKVTEKLQRIMVEELHHRVKNILATVQPIASQSLGAAQNIEDGRKAIESRLQALGRVHDVLLQTNWSKAKLAAILRAGIEPFITAAAPQNRDAKRRYRSGARRSTPSRHGSE